MQDDLNGLEGNLYIKGEFIGIAHDFKIACIALQAAASNCTDAMRSCSIALKMGFNANWLQRRGKKRCISYNGIANSKHKPRQVKMRGK